MGTTALGQCRWLLVLAGLCGAMAVGIGAFAAHGLPKRLEAQGFSREVVEKKLEQCDLGARYQMYHALGLAILGLVPGTMTRGCFRAAAVFFLLGILGFSGGLYSMVFADRAFHWSIVPIGGSAFILGWLSFACGAFQSGATQNGNSQKGASS